jgi:hypothetical protein
MIKYNISKEYLNACYEILERASNIGRFTKSDFQLIKKALNWLQKPNNRFQFSFNISQRVNGESVYKDFSISEESFCVSETFHSYENGVGGDTWTGIEYKASAKYNIDKGEVYKWLESANELLNFYENDDSTVNIYVSSEI